MHARSWIFLTALSGLVAAGAYHWHAQRVQSRLAAEHARRLAEIAEQRRLIEKDSRQAATARVALEKENAERASRLAAVSAARASVSATNAASTLVPQAVAAAPNPELRAWQVQAFVSDQRLRFAALLKRLGFTPEKWQEFDRIQGVYQHAMLDAAGDEPARQEVRQAHEAQLRDLFGSHCEEWLAANRDEPARAVVNQIVQMTFQSSGALTTAQADELTRIVVRHRILRSPEAGAGRPGYDWDRVMADANEILAPRQREDFAAAVEFRRASEKMSALASKRKP